MDDLKPTLQPNPGSQPPLAQQVLPWVSKRLSNTLHYKGGVRYEASLYGPLLTILTCIFTPDRLFMVKPQGLLRLEFEGSFSSDVGSLGGGSERGDDNDESDSKGEAYDFLSLMSAEAKDSTLVEDSPADLGDVSHARVEILVHAVRGGSRSIDLAPVGYSEGDVTTDSHRGFVSSKDYGHSFQC